ncbi:dynein heavy chain [Sorochytrium milnesiophthora]
MDVDTASGRSAAGGNASPLLSPSTPPPGTPSTTASVAPFDPSVIVSHLASTLLPSVFDEQLPVIARELSSKQEDVLEKCKRFGNEPTQTCLVVNKRRASITAGGAGKHAETTSPFVYDVQLEVTFAASLISSLVLLKRTPTLDPARALSTQISFVQLPGPAADLDGDNVLAAAASADTANGTTSPVPANNASSDQAFYETVHSFIHNAVAPYFHAYVAHRDRPLAGPAGEGQGTAGQLATKPDAGADSDNKAIPLAKKRFAELELSLLQLQQNVDVPEVTLQVQNDIVLSAINAARKSGTRLSVDAIPPESLNDSAFLNKVQAEVNSWIKEIQKVTKLSRDPGTTGPALSTGSNALSLGGVGSGGSGVVALTSASQEINFWLGMERSLERIDKQLKNEDIMLVLDILKSAKRFHATVSFRTDTGLQEAMEVVHKYNVLMKEFPIDELLSATDLGKVRDSLLHIFAHINKKLRLSPYPIRRALPLVEAISRDLNDQLIKILSSSSSSFSYHRRLMYLPYGEFEQTMAWCESVFSVWDEQVKDFANVARDVARKRFEKFLPIKIAAAHAKLQERIDFVRTFRKQHQQLQDTIVRVMSSGLSAPQMSSGAVVKAGVVTAIAASDLDAVQEVQSAYDAIKTVDVLDVTPEGTDAWVAAENAYNERVGRVENLIIARLRDSLGTAKTANEMFRVFSKFNALFVRPKIRGAIQEYQTQLIESVKDDIRKLQDKFKQQYRLSEAHAMSSARDIPPITGAIAWARQIERQLSLYMRHVEDVLGKGWEMYAEGQRLSADSAVFRKKLDARPIFENWLQDISKRDLSVTGRIFDIVRNRAQGNALQLTVSFDSQIITLFKEVRNLLWMNFHVPYSITNVAKDAKRVYPFAVSLMETVRTYQSTLHKVLTNESVGVLVAGFHKDVQTMVAKGIHLHWDAFVNTSDMRATTTLAATSSLGAAAGRESRQILFIRDLSSNVSIFQDKVDKAIAITTDINQTVEQLRTMPYKHELLAAALSKVQKAVDGLSLEGFTNLEHWTARLNQKLEHVLTARLQTALKTWVVEFAKDVDENQVELLSAKRRRRKHSASRLDIFVDDDEQTEEVKPLLDPLVHEIRLRDQAMFLSPPLEAARAGWYRQLQDWLAVVCNLPRIQASRFEMDLQADYTYADLTFRHLLMSLPDGSLAAVYQLVETKLHEAQQYVKVWLQYQSLWDLEPQAVFARLGDDLSKWQQILLEIRRARSTFDTSQSEKSFGAIIIDYEQVQAKVNAKYDQWQRDVLTKFGAKLGQTMRDTYNTIAKSRHDLEHQSAEGASTADAVSFIIFVQELKRKVAAWAADVEVFRSGQKVLERQRFLFPADWLYIEQIDGEWSAFNEILTRKNNAIQDQIAGLQQKIVVEDRGVEQKMKDVMAEWDKSKPVQGDIAPETAIATLNIFEGRLTRVKNDFEQISKAKEALGLDRTSENRLVPVLEELRDLKSVWSALSTVWASFGEIKDTLWSAVAPRKVRQQLDSLLNETKEMPNRMRQYAAFEHVQDVLKQHLRVNALVTDLKSEALRERHWKQLLKTLRMSDRIVWSEMTLSHVWQLDLKRNEAVIRDIIAVAQGEMALEEFLRQVKETWTNYALELVNYQNKCRLIKGWDELFTKCSEHLNSLQAMKLSPYYKTFEEDAVNWEDKLNRTHVLFDVWIDVQRQWVYLEGIFTGSADIKHLLPIESSRFQNINAEFLSVMKKVYKSPFVLDVLNLPNIQKSLERLADLLSKIQKALGEYLERERSSFPRFYFVGDEDLLEVIGNSKDIMRTQKHLKKMFAGLSSMVLSDDCTVIQGMSSREGETVPFKRPVSVKENPKINDWLALLEKEMKHTLADLVQEAHAELSRIYFAETLTLDNVTPLLDKYPAQVVVLVFQILWTDAVERSWSGGSAQKTSLGASLGYVERILTLLADAVLSDITAIRRRKCEHLITELVHERDVVRALLRDAVVSASDFQWVYHMRFYLDASAADPLQRLVIRMANAKFYYGYEYLGIADRLVQTPLTDRCYLTLTQALESRLGGSPFGPAGTGKTESVKALGTQLGRFVLVFCCDENFDFQAMGRIFIGLCQVGAWGCFDEFNRLEERILSAVSQQVQSIQLGLKAMTRNASAEHQIELVGKSVRVNPDTGIFITMNPGYAGRSNLPDNLKKLFRSVAMTTPDRELIAQVMLYSQGFRWAEMLASKVVPLFNLCSEQLSPQSHYDFGLRALKSVLVTAGNLKRDRLVASQSDDDAADLDSLSNDVAEQRILIQSVCETMLPKLVAEDIPLLRSLLSDVFPGIDHSPVDLAKLRQAVLDVCKARHLVAGEAWLDKVLQLYQIQGVHHGLMMVGPSGSGKSTAWRVLLEALERVEGVEGVSYVIDPKAIAKEHLYGTLDQTTREWTDGLFTHALRKIIDNVRGESAKRHWIVFDGDVDPEYVENMNSLLDDNKLLTLPNGERLALPNNVRIMFEVETLRYATLATVSRCGMVWFSEEVVGLDMMFEHYLTTLRQVPLSTSDEDFAAQVTAGGDAAHPEVSALAVQRRVADIISPHLRVDGFVAKALEFAGTLEHIMDFTTSRVLETLFSLINKTSRMVFDYDAHHPDFPLSGEQLENFVLKRLVSAVVWSFSGDARLELRQQLSEYVHGITTLDLPPRTDSIIDYDVNIATGDWVSWQSRVPQIEVETHNVSQADVVIPTVDTVRHEEVLYSWLSEHKPVLLCGPPGSGKTMTLFSALRKLPEMEVAGLNFSSATTPELVLKTLEQYCEYRKTPNGVVLAPVMLARWLVVFCDEINLPSADKYGTQRVISFLRQLVEHNGFWRASDKSWVTLERIQFVGACNPPTDPGRVPLSHRFLRHAPLVMVDYPGAVSLKQIYGTFSRALLKVVPTLRGYADALTNAMVDFYLASQKRYTPDMQAHYVYSPRELTRWVRGIYEAIKPHETLSIDELVRVWAHEALRLFQDRLVHEDERRWTDEKLDELAQHYFPNANTSVALARPILFSNWLSKHYVPVERGALREFVKARLRVFYEEELDVQLVLFNDVLEHVLRIDRVFRQMQGHLLLIGVSGSGKTTLSRFVAWMNGFSVFQIKAHNKYTGEDFDDDLRTVLRRAGCKGEKICFIMDESNVLDSGFLERMNTLLANAEVPGLFEGDEHAALMTQCKEGAARDGLMLDSAEELYKWFTQQVMKNLHVVFTMNPPENGLASRTATSPALFNRCVLDWFGDWSDQAFYQVGKEFTDTLDLDLPSYKSPDAFPIAYRDLPLPPNHRDAIVNAFVFVHTSLYDANAKLSKRAGRHNYCTPRHYLDFINHYVHLFQEKREDLEEQQRHLNVGLDKLHDTVEKVSELRKSLAVKKAELEAKTEQANDKLKQMVEDQQEAESKKTASMQIQEILARQNKEIEERTRIVMADLANAEPAVIEAQKSVSSVKKQHLTEVRSMANPPEAVKIAMESVCTLLGHQIDSWRSVQAVIRRDDFIASIVNYDTDKMLTRALRDKMKREFLSNVNFNFEVVNRASKACGPLVSWVIAQVNYAEILERVGPLRQEVAELERTADETKVKASTIEKMIDELQQSITRYKDEYAVLISETQALKTEMERVKSKVDRSVSLLASLSSEQARWEQTSQGFDTQMSTIVGDVLLSAAFLAYAGYFDQQNREMLFHKWADQLHKSRIQFKQDLALVEYLSTADNRLSWQTNALPADDLCMENAIMLDRYKRYPLIIDPSGQASEFLANQYRDRKITVTSFLDDSFVKNLESALRFGNPILIQNVENLDPILNPILNRELRKTGGRVLIRLGNQDIDFSPSFALFLSTRDPSVDFPPDVCSRVTFVNFTVTKSSLQAQCLNKVLKAERPDVDQKRTDLVRLQGEFRLRLRHLEKSLLQALNESRGNILDDDAVIATLEVLKREAAEVQRKVDETDTVMEEVDAVTAVYTPLSQACSAIFFAMDRLSAIHHFYQFSLDFFYDIFNQVLLHNPKLASVTEPARRLAILSESIFREAFRRTCSSLLHADYVTFAMLLTHIRLRTAALMEDDEMDFLLLGAATPLQDVNENSLQSAEFAARMRELAKVPAFKDIAQSVSGDQTEQWRSFLGAADPLGHIPRCWTSRADDNAPHTSGPRASLLGALVVKAFRPDFVIPAVEAAIAKMFGDNFMSSESSLREIVMDEVASSSPVAICSVPGYDASNRVEKLAEEVRAECAFIAMGSAEGFALAEKAVAAGAQRGTWVLLKNVHLAPQWLGQLEKKLHTLRPHASFRLFLTMETNPKVPVNLLRQSRIVMYEPPPGIRANLLDTLTTIPSAFVQAAPAERTRLYFLLAWLHATVQERLRYVPLGWTKTYEFNDADQDCAISTVNVWLEQAAQGRSNIAPEKIPWAAVRTLLKETIYGGRIDNDFDQRVLNSFVDRLFVPATYSPSFALVDSATDRLTVPEGTKLEHFVKWAEALPEHEPSSWLGLPNHAEKIISVMKGYEMLSKVYKMRSLEEDDDTVYDVEQDKVNSAQQPAWMRTVHAQVEQWLAALPEDITAISNLDQQSSPLVRFFVRENILASRMLQLLRTDLQQLQRVCRDGSKQTNRARSLLDSLAKGAIPREWLSYRVPKNMQLSQWFEDLLRRFQQTDAVAQSASVRPNLEDVRVSLGRLFHPEAYITATRQYFAQKNQWSLEELQLSLAIGEAQAGKGFVLDGLRVEGCAWQNNQLVLSSNVSDSLPATQLCWTHRTKQQANDGEQHLGTLPVYLNKDRSHVLFTAQLALDPQLTAHSIIQRGVALIASSD